MNNTEYNQLTTLVEALATSPQGYKELLKAAQEEPMTPKLQLAIHYLQSSFGKFFDTSRQKSPTKQYADLKQVVDDLYAKKKKEAREAGAFLAGVLEYGDIREKYGIKDPC